MGKLKMLPLCQNKVKIPNSKKLQDQTNRKIDKIIDLSKKLFGSDMSGKNFERLKERIYKLAEKTEPDAKLVRLSEDPERVIN